MASSSNVGPSLHGGKTTYDVFVGSLPAESNEKNVAGLFIHYGDIQSILIKDSNRGDGLKVAFVRFLCEDHANRAAAEVNGYQLEGRKLFCKRSEVRKKTPGMQPGMQPENQQKKTRPFTQKPNMTMFGKEPDIVSQAGSISPDRYNKQPRTDFLQEQIMVTYVETPVTFYGQLFNSRAQELVTMSELLLSICPCSNRLSGKPTFNKIYASQFSEDQTWYRCKALQYMSDAESRVQYIDYGNSEVVQNSAIVELPANLTSIGQFAGKYCLRGYKPVTCDENSEEFVKGVDYLKLCTENKLVNAKVYSPRSGAGTPEVDIECDSIDIGESMLIGGHVYRILNQQQHQEPNKMQNQQMMKPRFTPPQVQREYGAEGDMNSNISSPPVGKIPDTQVQSLMGGVDLSKLKGPRRITSSENNFVNSEKNASPRNVNSVEMNSLRAEIDFLKRELENARKQLHSKSQHDKEWIMGLKKAKQECENVTQDRDLVMQQLGANKAQLNALQNDFEVVCQRLKDNNLTEKLQGLLMRVEKVKELRCQFPTDTNTKDNLEQAVKLVTDNASKVSIDNVQSITGLLLSLENYRSCQEQVQTCAEKALLDDLIKSRDEARIQLHNHMEEFLNEVEKLPLQKRLDELKEAKADLEASHGRIINAYCEEDMLPFSDSLAIYKDWQEQRYLEFSDVRTATNTCHNAVNNVLKSLQQNLSLEVTQTVENKASSCNLDSLLNRLDQAVRVEIDKTDVENLGDAKTVALVLRAVKEDINQEEGDIEKLLKMQNENLENKKTLSLWLHTKPDIEDIKAARKSIRSLKSKLRHSLAEFEDLKEEIEDTDEDRIQEVKSELVELRHQIHAAYEQEDQMLDELAQLNDNHFPELSQLYPDLGIENHAEFSGLVKQGRDLDQFCIESIPGVEKKSILKTRYMDHDVVLKEYIVDESHGLKKSDFLKRTLTYKAVSSPHILPLEAVFFLKNDRQAYVQTQYYEKKLCTMVEEKQLSDEQISTVLSGVLKGLHALHEAKLMHGHVHPDNVFVNEQGQGILAEYDFSRSLVQRASKVYSVSSGLKFVSPEANTPKGEVSKASDLYNFGLLMLWMHFPHVHFNENDGYPDFSALGLPHSVLDVIQNLLTPDPLMRLTTEQLLQLPYFATRRLSDTLQLRHRQTSPVQNSTQNTTNGRPGILKNSTSAVSERSPETLSQKDDTNNVSEDSPSNSSSAAQNTASGSDHLDIGSNDSDECPPKECQNIVEGGEKNGDIIDNGKETEMRTEISQETEPSTSGPDGEISATRPDILETVQVSSDVTDTDAEELSKHAAIEAELCEMMEEDLERLQAEEETDGDVVTAQNEENGQEVRDESDDTSRADEQNESSEEKKESCDEDGVTSLAQTDGATDVVKKGKVTTASLLTSRLSHGVGRGLSLTATLADMERKQTRPGGQVEDAEEDE